MSPLKRLFGARRQPSLDEQLSALEGQTESALLALVQSDSQETLREAALGRLGYSQELLKLALDESNARTQHSARKRIGQLLEEQQLSVDTLAEAVTEQAQLLALCSYSARAGQAVLEQISEPALLLELATHGASIHIRCAAAERITTRPELEQLYKAAQGRDKTVYKLAKGRLETFKAEDARRAETEAQARVICDKLEQLIKVEQDPMFQAKLDKLAQDWAKLPITPPGELAQRYEQSLNQLRQQQAEREQAEAEEQALQEAEQKMQAEARDKLNETRGELLRLVHGLYDANPESLTSERFDEELAGVNSALNTLVEGTQSAEGPSQKEQQQLARQAQQAAELLNLLRERGTLDHWLDQLSQAETDDARKDAQHTLKELLKGARALPEGQRPDNVQKALAQLHTLEDAEKQAANAQRKLVRELEGLTRQGLSAARGGQVRRARGLHRAVQEKRPALERLPNHLASKLDELDQAIDRLSDWHEFAVTPKKEALIRSMQALQNKKMAPEELARKIHHLQDDWREVSKGVPHHDEDLWHQFQEASHKAFEPCREFFHAQAQERDANQAKREELIEQLSQYVEGYDWDNPVWKDVEATLKQARREWRAAWPVPRQAVKAQEARFEPLMEQVHNQLNEGYEAHRRAKEELVARAGQLAELDDLHQAIEGAKQLQAEWKAVGSCRPRDDQALWKQFRQHCDAIFGRRQEQFEAADQQRQAEAQEAENLIQQLRDLQQTPMDNPGSQRARIDELKAAFHNLGELPRARVQALNDDFHKALKALDQRQNQARLQARERQRQQLLNAAEAVRALELAHLSGSETSSAQEEADTALASVELWPGDSRARLERRRADAEQLSAQQQQKNLEALKLLCIRAEILTGQATPEADKTLRMNYQMQQLQQGLGQSEDAAETLLLEWLSLGGAPDPDYSQLLGRFQENLKDQF